MPRMVIYVPYEHGPHHGRLITLLVAVDIDDAQTERHTQRSVHPLFRSVRTLHRDDRYTYTDCSVPWNMAEPSPVMMTPMNCTWKRGSKPCVMDWRRP